MWWSLTHLTLKAHTFLFMLQHYYRNFEHVARIMDTKSLWSQVDDSKLIVTHVHGFEHCFEPSSQFETKSILVN